MDPTTTAGSVDYDYLLKVVLIGDSGVGKTALLRRLCHNEFINTHMSTIGVDFNILTRVTSSGKTVKLQCWDTAGQERFQTITSNYYRGAHAVMIVCDVTNAETMHNISKWCRDFQYYNPQCSNILIVGNKSDRVYERQVSQDQLKELADTLQLELEPVETSAFIGNATIAAAMDCLVNHACASQSQTICSLNDYKVQIHESRINLEENVNSSKRSSCCRFL